MLSNTNPKKVQKKQKNNKDKDYLIFDVSKNVFYKKILSMNNNNNKLGYPDNSSMQVNTFIKSSANNTNNLFNDSPKMMVKVNKLPLNFIQDYII